MIKEIEKLIADKLASLTVTGGAKLFKTAEPWAYQVTDAGTESFERYSPFAFVKYLPADTDRAGGLDLVRVLNFAVTIGVHDNLPRHKVISLLEQVIAAIDRKHPLELYVGEQGQAPTSIPCDILLASDEIEIIDGAKNYAMSVIFEAKAINN